jgi:hypothetical protein
MMSKAYRDAAEVLVGGTRKEILEELAPKYKHPGRTKQSFKDQCDINQILKKAQVAGGISHVQKYDKAVYGEFDQTFDLLTARERIAAADKIFMDLPAEVRNEFGNDSLAFVKFAGDPANNDKLEQIIPAIAEPGNYFPNPVSRGGKGAGAATAPQTASEAPEEPISPPPESPSTPAGE